MQLGLSLPPGLPAGAAGYFPASAAAIPGAQERSAPYASNMEWRFGEEDAEWKPISTPAFVGWMIFYAWFLLYAARNTSGFLFIDNANLVVHEGGHALFGWFGNTLGIMGGTLLQWMVPALLAAYFFYHRQISGFVFCTFFFFENFLYTATYMADARAEALPLVSLGDSDYIEHDWNTMFGWWGLLLYDTRIAGFVRFLGWMGMISIIGWMGYRYWMDRGAQQFDEPGK
jgi:hypothetical protein